MGRIQDLAVTREPYEFEFFVSGLVSNGGKVNER